MKWRSALLWILGVVVVATMGYRFRDSFFNAMGTLSGLEILAWVVLTLALRILLAHGFVFSVRQIGATISHYDAFLLGWVRSFFNQLVPLSGTAANAIYMKRTMKLDWGQLGSLGTPQFIIAMQATLYVAAAAFVAVAPILGWPAMLAAVLSFTAGLFLSRLGVEHLLIAVSKAFPFATKRFSLDPASIIEFSPRTRQRLTIVFFLAALLRFFRLLVLFVAIDAEMPIVSIFFVSAITEISSIAQLTPGGLGLRELLILGVGIVVGGNTDILASAALIDRVFTIGLILLFGSISIYALRQKLMIDKR